MKHRLCAGSSCSLGSTFNVQLLFLTSTKYFQMGICTGQTSNEFPAFANTQTEGSVKVVKNDNVKMLTPGQQAHLDDSGELSVLKNVNTNEIVAWKNDLFSFDNTDIKNLMRQVSRWYDVEIVMPQNIVPVTFKGNISRKLNLSNVLKMLELTGEVAFSIEDKKVIVNI